MAAAISPAAMAAALIGPVIGWLLNMCPVAEGEVAHRKSRRFFDKLSCDKFERVITQDEGAELHCSVNGPSVKHQIVFDWLDGVFQKS